MKMYVRAPDSCIGEVTDQPENADFILKVGLTCCPYSFRVGCFKNFNNSIQSKMQMIPEVAEIYQWRWSEEGGQS